VIIDEIGLCIQITPGKVVLGNKDKNIFVEIPCKLVKGVIGEIMRAEGEALKLDDLTKQCEKLIHDNNNGDIKKL